MAARSVTNPPRSTFALHPSTLDPRPSTLDPRPSTLDLRPSPFTPQSPIDNPQSTILNPQSTMPSPSPFVLHASTLVPRTSPFDLLPSSPIHNPLRGTLRHKPPEGLKDMRMKWIKGVGLALLSLVLITLLMFRGDWRVFAGFDQFISSKSEGVPIHFQTCDPDVAKSDTVSKVLVSKASTWSSWGRNPHTSTSPDFGASRSGPTLIFMESGRIIVTAGVTYEYHVRDGIPRAVVFAD